MIESIGKTSVPSPISINEFNHDLTKYIIDFLPSNQTCNLRLSNKYWNQLVVEKETDKTITELKSVKIIDQYIGDESTLTKLSSQIFSNISFLSELKQAQNQFITNTYLSVKVLDTDKLIKLASKLNETDDVKILKILRTAYINKSISQTKEDKDLGELAVQAAKWGLMHLSSKTFHKIKNLYHKSITAKEIVPYMTQAGYLELAIPIAVDKNLLINPKTTALKILVKDALERKDINGAVALAQEMPVDSEKTKALKSTINALLFTKDLERAREVAELIPGQTERKIVIDLIQNAAIIPILNFSNP